MKKMSKKKRKEFHTIFTGERAKIMKSLSSNNVIDGNGDEVDRVQGTVLESISSHLSERDKFRLVAIEAAIARLGEGSFGECEECDNPIAEARLIARPESTTCIKCAEELETIGRDFMY